MNRDKLDRIVDLATTALNLSDNDPDLESIQNKANYFVWTMAFDLRDMIASIGLQEDGTWLALESWVYGSGTNMMKEALFLQGSTTQFRAVFDDGYAIEFGMDSDFARLLFYGL